MQQDDILDLSSNTVFNFKEFNTLFKNKDIKELIIRECKLSDKIVNSLLKAIEANNIFLNVLNLSYNSIGSPGAKAISNSQYMSHLTHLDLSNNMIDDEGAKGIAKSHHMSELINLELAGNDLSIKGAELIVDSPFINKLVSFSLWYKNITDAEYIGNDVLGMYGVKGYKVLSKIVFEREE